MATRNEQLARVGSAVQMGAMLAAMVDANTTGTDDRVAGIAQKIGAALVKASTGDVKTAAGILDTAGDALKDLAAEMRAGG